MVENRVDVQHAIEAAVSGACCAKTRIDGSPPRGSSLTREEEHCLMNLEMETNG